MSVLRAMQSAAIRLVGYKPSVFFASSEQFEQEIVDLANEVARDICEYHDWQALTKIETLTGDGVQEVFPLPTDYSRQLLDSDIQDLQNWVWGYQHMTNINDFIFLRARGFGIVPGAWILYNDELNFYPAPETGNSASYPYVSKNYARGASGNLKEEFTEDTDEFIIRKGEDLLTLGLVWRWRENKKLDYTGDQEAFTMKLEEMASRDKGSSIIRHGRRLRGLNTAWAYPFSLGP